MTIRKHDLSLYTFLYKCVVRNEKSQPGFHESVFCSLQALRDKEFSIFQEKLKQARYKKDISTLMHFDP